MRINNAILSLICLPFLFPGISGADTGTKSLYAAKGDMRIVFIGDESRIGVLMETFGDHGFRKIDATRSRPECIMSAKDIGSGESTRYGMYCHGGKQAYQGGMFVFSNNHGRTKEALSMLPSALEILHRSTTQMNYVAMDFIHLPWMSAVCLKNGCIPLYPSYNDG